MCEGYYGDAPPYKPWLPATLSLGTEVDGETSFRSGAAVDLLVDTGADATCVTRATAERAGLSVGSMDPVDEVRGIGEETSPLYVWEGQWALTFDEREAERSEASTGASGAAQPNREPRAHDFHTEFFEDLQIVPSLEFDLLGRDFLRRFEVELCHDAGRIDLRRREGAGGEWATHDGSGL